MLVAEQQAAKLTLQQLQTLKEHQAGKHVEQSQRLLSQQFDQRRAEKAVQQARFRKGIVGFLDRLTGRKKKVEAQNQAETLEAMAIVQAEQQALRRRQDTERLGIQSKAEEVKTHASSVREELSEDIKTLISGFEKEASQKRETFKAKRRASAERPKLRSRNRDGPSFSP